MHRNKFKTAKLLTSAESVAFAFAFSSDAITVKRGGKKVEDLILDQI